MNAEIIAIGTELLLGDVVDTNTPHIARGLRRIGLDLLYTSVVGDNTRRIAEAVRRAVARSTVVITTGGLGPTVDDMTREGVAEATGRPLVFDESLWAQIQERFHKWGRTASPNNRRQAYRPEGSTVIENPVGTAPSFIVDGGGSLVISLPGVPREMEYLLERAVLPYLRERLALRGLIKRRLLLVAGLGESVIDEKIGDLELSPNPTVGLSAHAGVVDVRITAKAENEAEADRMIAAVERAARERLGDSIFGVDDETLEAVVTDALADRNESVAVIESGTGGKLGGRLANADAGRGLFRGGEVAPRDSSGGAESAARAVAEKFGATRGVSCFVREADHESEVSVGVWHSGGAARYHRGFGGHAALASEWAVNLALDWLRRSLSKH